jgi:predicted PolB exonuclease-like 3'-5' exonuclease
MASPNVRFLVFDVESVADGELIAKVRYPGESLTAAEAIRRYRTERQEQYGTDFIPYPYQVPVAIVVAKVSPSYELLDVVALDEPQPRPHVLTKNFWRGWEMYGRPTLVSFNGRSFDLPLLELAAFRYGISLAGWLDVNKPSYQQHRYRYNLDGQTDLLDLLTNFGAVRFSGGLNLAASLLGKPGKTDVQGAMVQDMYDAGQLQEIIHYCRRDVLDTYFVFLRAALLLGNISLEREQAIVAQTKQWLTDRAPSVPAFREYMEHWGDWPNPWTEEVVVGRPAATEPPPGN